jgi:hypothetical protein
MIEIRGFGNTNKTTQKIKEMMGSFNMDTVAKACKSLRSKI